MVFINAALLLFTIFIAGSLTENVGFDPETIFAKYKLNIFKTENRPKHQWDDIKTETPLKSEYGDFERNLYSYENVSPVNTASYEERSITYRAGPRSILYLAAAICGTSLWIKICCYWCSKKCCCCKKNENDLTSTSVANLVLSDSANLRQAEECQTDNRTSQESPPSYDEVVVVSALPTYEEIMEKRNNSTIS